MRVDPFNDWALQQMIKWSKYLLNEIFQFWYCSKKVFMKPMAWKLNTWKYWHINCVKLPFNSIYFFVLDVWPFRNLFQHLNPKIKIFRVSSKNLHFSFPYGNSYVRSIFKSMLTKLHTWVAFLTKPHNNTVKLMEIN